MPKTRVPKITFVGGKWYNERGQEVSKPAPPQPLWDTRTFPGVASSVPIETVRHEQLQRYVKPAGCACADPGLTGHFPGCKFYVDALHVCEMANVKTIAGLAQMAKTTIMDLEHRRNDYVKREACPAMPTDTPRRRCLFCPFWTQHPQRTPFDHQKQEAV